MSTVVEHRLFASSVRMLDVFERIYMRAMAYIVPVKVCRTFFGALLKCSAGDFVQRRIRFFQIFEHNLTYYTMQTLREGDYYVDVGANVGYFSLLASRYVGPSGKVISIEADPVTFARLQDNLALNSTNNVVAKNVAAMADTCKVRIERGDARNWGANTVAMAEGAGTVDGLPFREIVGDDIGKIKFIKIDIDTAEAPVLQAILDLLPELRDDIVVASEICEESAPFVERFRKAGFRSFAIQNIYSIDYYLIRSFMKRFDEDRNVVLVPVDGYDRKYRDYVFERE